MDGLSSAASGIAVISIAIQLAESVKKITEFWDSVSRAPDYILGIVHDLRDLERVLEETRDLISHHGYDATMKDGLERCSHKIGQLANILNDIEPGFSSTSRRERKWASIKAVLRGDRVKRFQESLSETKLTLVLMRQNLSDRKTWSLLKSQQQSLTAISEGVASLHMGQSGRTVVTSSAKVSDASDDHTADLRAEVEQMASALTSHHLRSVFADVIGRALEDAVIHDRHSLHAVAMSMSQTRKRREYPTPHDNVFLSSRVSKNASSARERRCKRSRWHSSTTTSVTTLFGRVYIRSNFFISSAASFTSSKSPSNLSRYVTETTFILHPAAWLIKLGMGTGLDIISRSTQGWRNSIMLRTFRAITDDSPIFRMCEGGDLDGVRTLLTRGEASAWDRNSYGETPLHMASANHELEICQLLIDAGADETALTYLTSSPAMSACYDDRKFDQLVRNGRTIDPHRKMGTLRLFSNCFDFADNVGQDAWQILGWLLFSDTNSLVSYRTSDGDHFVSKRFVEAFCEDIIQNLSCDAMLRVLVCCQSSRLLEWFLSITGGLPYLIRESDGWSPLVILLRTWDLLRTRNIIFYLAKHGASLHSPYEYQTPSSIAARKSQNFRSWQKLLEELEVDLEAFVIAEFEAGPWFEDGWSLQNLTQLFLFKEHSPRCTDQIGRRCHYCDECILLVDVSWLAIVERIKSGRDFVTGLDLPPCCKRCWGLGVNQRSPDESNIEEETPLLFHMPGSFE